MRFCLCLAVAIVACEDGGDVNGPPPVEVPDLALDTVATGLPGALYVTAPPGDPRLFIVQQGGIVRVIDDTLLTAPFLDIQSRVVSGGERGLLSIAFHPDYAQNGEFFVYYYTEQRSAHTRVARFRVSPDPNVADPLEETLLAVDQPAPNHNGGLVKFGSDRMLYIGLGDGGGANDQFGNGQDSTTLLGSILRIDVDGPFPYAIPPGNPLVEAPDARPEIWAYGLRNPWRFSFDTEAGNLYIADVGQNEWEEVSVARAASGGLNYGWNIMEGLHCFQPATACDQTGLTLPVIEYANNGGGNCSVTGGYVYRGARMPGLQGHYFYGDFCSGFVRSFRYTGGAVTDERDWTSQLGTVGNLSSFGEDASGELYITTLGGTVYRIVPAGG